MVTRLEPPDAADEKTLLVAFLGYYRATLLLKAEGLSDHQARTKSVVASDLNLMGLIRHMSDVERHWFRRWFLADTVPGIYWNEGDDDPDHDLHPGENDTLADAVAAFQAEVAQSDAILHAASLDDRSKRIGEPERSGFQPSLRWIVVHLIEEYARHCGHADLLRQSIDGAVGD